MRRMLGLGLAGATVVLALFMWRPRTERVLPPSTDATHDLGQRLASHVRALAGDIGPRHVRRPSALEAAATYIEQRLMEHSYTVQRQPFDIEGETVANLEALTGPPTPRYFVVGAHYDTVPTTPGADDNASGVAVLLELARLHALRASHLPVRFVAFVNEEPPWFQTERMGSLVYASRARAAGDDVLGMIALETMGYYSDAAESQHYPPPFHLFFPSTGHFLAAVSNGRSYRLLRQFARAFKAGSPLPLVASPAPQRVPGVGWSDHWSFWQHGYRALLLTDTAPYRNPHYHAAGDTPETLDYVRLALATEGIAHALLELPR